MSFNLHEHSITAMKRRLLVIATIMSSLTTPAIAADAVVLHAAGSLRGALTEVAQGFEKSSGLKVQAKFGASGLLKDEIAAGVKAEVFASANMEHPQALAKANKSGPVVLFARNKLCALVRPGLAVTGDTLLERMLDPRVKLGTSTPKADPSGDYAFEAFRKAEAVQPSSQSALEQKRSSSRAARAAPLRPPGAMPMAGILPKAAPTSFWPIAPPPAMHRRKIPACK
jgi:ABC-type molybdate transport system substrate-binding protein